MISSWFCFTPRDESVQMSSSRFCFTPHDESVQMISSWFCFDTLPVSRKSSSSSWFYWLFFCCFFNLYFISCLIFIISVLLNLGFLVLLFLILLGGRLGCLLEICHLLRNACFTMNFALSTAFATSHRVWYGCVFIVNCLKVFLISLLVSSLIHWFFSRALFRLHVMVEFFFLISFLVVDFFSFFFFRLICAFICQYNLTTMACKLLWSEKIQFTSVQQKHTCITCIRMYKWNKNFAQNVYPEY